MFKCVYPIKLMFPSYNVKKEKKKMFLFKLVINLPCNYDKRLARSFGAKKYPVTLLHGLRRIRYKNFRIFASYIQK